MKHIYKLTGLLFAIFALWSCTEDLLISANQFASIRGQALFNVSRQPVRRALVKLSPSGRITETDSLGKFHFDSVAVGDYTVQVTKDLYRTEVSTVQADPYLVSVLTFLLIDDKSQNRPPSAPFLSAPASGTTGVTTTVMLKWKSVDPGSDSLKYNVSLFREGSITPTTTYSALKADSLLVTNLAYSTAYYWQVSVNDGVNTVKGDVWSFQTQSLPDFSFVYARRVNNQYQLFTGNATGEVIQLTKSASNWRPIVSPNRQSIAFISNLDTEPNLYVMNMDGTGMRRVTTVPLAGVTSLDLSFCWSPDGTELLYPNNDRLYAVHPDGTGLRIVMQASGGNLFAGCDWTPQGNRIVARTTGGNVYTSQISVFSATGGTMSTVLSRTGNRVGNPVFSVNGQQVAFTIDASGFQNEQGRQLDARIYLLNLATNDLVDLSSVSTNNQVISNKPSGSNDLDPRFSPNGSQLIFTNTDNSGNGLRNLFTIDINGQNRTQVIGNAEYSFWR